MNDQGLDRVFKNIDLLLSCGEAMVEFYQTCAQTWPRESQFWGDLALDEMEHMTRLQLMQQRAKDSKNVAASIRIFSPAALATFHAGATSSRARVRSGEIKKRGALSIAREMERSPIVNDQYLVTRQTEPELANYLLSFATDFDKHTKQIDGRLGTLAGTAQAA